MSLYVSLGGPDWTDHGNWTDDNLTDSFDLRTWHGVTATGTGVKILNLEDNNLVGKLTGLQQQ